MARYNERIHNNQSVRSGAAMRIQDGRLQYYHAEWADVLGIAPMTMPVTGTWDAGMEVTNVDPHNGESISWLCAGGGTYGDLTAVAGTCVAGNPQVTVSGGNHTSITVGKYIHIAGVPGYHKVTGRSGNVLTVVPAPSTTQTNAPVLYQPPTWTCMGATQGDNEMAISSGNEIINVNGSVITAQGLAYPIFNAAIDYGADRTGTNDATAAIQSAVSAALAAGGGVVYLPRGTYRLDGSVTLGNNIHLSGQGALRTIIQRNGSSTSAMFNYSPASANVENITIEELSIVNTTANCVGLVLSAGASYEVKNIIMRGVVFSNTKDNVAARCVEIKQKPRNVFIQNCTFQSASTPTANQSRVYGQVAFYIPTSSSECTDANTISFDNCLFTGGQIGLATDAQSGDTYGVSAAVTITNCTFLSQTMCGVRLKRAYSVRAANNHFGDIDCVVTAADLADEASGNNWPEEKGALWIEIVRATGASDATRGAVAVVTGNTFTKITGNAMFITNGGHMQIMGNIINTVYKRTGGTPTLESYSPSGYSSVGGVGIFVGGGTNRLSISNNTIHYCEHAGIRVCAGFSDPTYTDGYNNLSILNNQISEYGTYGIEFNGNFTSGIDVSHNKIVGTGGEEPTSVAGILFSRSASHAATEGIVRFIAVGNIIESGQYGIRKTYVIDPVAGMALTLVANEIGATQYSVFWESAQGSLIGNWLRNRTYKLDSPDGVMERHIGLFQNGINVSDDYTIYRGGAVDPTAITSGLARTLVLENKDTGEKVRSSLETINGREWIIYKELPQNSGGPLI